MGTSLKIQPTKVNVERDIFPSYNPSIIKSIRATEDKHTKEKADDNVHKQAGKSIPRTAMLQPRRSEGYRGMELVPALEPSLFERDNRMT